MSYFTSLNVIHRDLKPSNIFLDAKVCGDLPSDDQPQSLLIYKIRDREMCVLVILVR